jgi:hypothetical protein
MQPAASLENRRDSMAGQKERQKSCPIDKIAARQIAENGRLIAIVFLGLNRMRDGQPQIAEFLAKGLAGDPKNPGGLMLVAVRKPQHQREQDSVELFVSRRIKIDGTRFKPLLNERLEVESRGCFRL